MSNCSIPVEFTLSVSSLIRRFPGKVSITWFLVFVENVLLALIPLFIGKAIDGLLAGHYESVIAVAVIFTGLTLVSVGRRIYDTRAYGTMRVFVGEQLVVANDDLEVSQLNARLLMSREFVDFLEAYVPDFMVSVVQLIVALAILMSYGFLLGVSASVAAVAILLTYALFHRRIFKLNARLNEQTEKQVRILDRRQLSGITRHLTALRKHEVSLSDTDAFLYGTIFLLMGAFVLANLVLAAQIDGVTAGVIFIVVSYSWEFVESGFALPEVLQQWTRLSEISGRINSRSV
ncbi:MAG: ABC transporter six-transmembrane domain-containing protein [Pseudomonadota bacterium]